FSKRLRKSFNESGDADVMSALQRTRVDARTVGYPTENDNQVVEWMGMSPAGDKGDLWYVLTVTEKPNQYLSQINQHERLVDITRVMGKGEDEKPLSFEKAIEHLAVWEHARVMRGYKPVTVQLAQNLGRHHYKDLAMRRGFAVTTTGALTAIRDILPQDAGKFLKSDLQTIEKYRSKLGGANALDELLATHDPLYVRETTIEDDLQSFGEIAVFDKMELAASVLVAYARMKLQNISEFYANPAAKGREDLAARLNNNPYFDADLVARANDMRNAIGMSVLRYFHFRESDWSKPLDLDSREMKVELLKNPHAKAALDILTRPLVHPMGSEDVRGLLFLCARSLIYFREMMKDSPQRDALERRDIFKQADVNDLLNFLDLLEIKYQYKALAEAAFALPGTQRYRELKTQKEAFQVKVLNLKDNLKETADFSVEQERQIDEFIKAGSQVYLIDRLAALPGRIAAAHRFVSDAVLPKSQQLSLDFDYSACVPQRVARPTRGPLPGAPTNPRP
ncbi:MAG: hypothetical protein KKA05_01825, partial [Alphaproteobacteria bacterium]|nr:hypothetical protein [Alphaproteobacteria bacterium]